MDGERGQEGRPWHGSLTTRILELGGGDEGGEGRGGGRV